ncbi:MAG: cytosine permease [bacterium]|jgi:putative hydroxymethylpyrimidine transporter CytX
MSDAKQAAAQQATGEWEEMKESSTREAGRLSGLDTFLLWFGAAVVIDEMWSGAQVTPLGIGLGLIVILAAKFTGNLLLALVARMGSEALVPTMVLSRASFGIRGSVFPAVCNILQLIGWTAYMLIVAAKAVGILFGAELTGAQQFWTILALGLLTTAWAAGGSRYWKIANNIAVFMLIALTIVMTYGVFSKFTIDELLRVVPPAGPSPMLTFDFVVAMAVSWVPLAADYGRFASSRRAAFAGTYWGYFTGSAWMYAIGLIAGMAYLKLHPGTAVEALEPNTVVLGALHGMKLISAGILLIALSTITTTFLDVYSTAASSLNIWPKANASLLAVIGGLFGTALAFFVKMDQYTQFLLLIGVVFLPMFAVVAADYFFVKKCRINSAALFDRGGEYWYAGGFNAAAIAAWIIGMAISLWAGAPWWLGAIFGIETWQAWPIGAAIPSFAASGAIYLLLAKLVLKKS